MKRILSVMLVVFMIISASMLKVGATTGDSFKHDSTETIKEMESRAGIEIKEDSEVFSIIKSTDNLEIYFIEQDESLSFTPNIYDESNQNKSVEPASEMKALNRGFMLPQLSASQIPLQHMN